MWDLFVKWLKSLFQVSYPPKKTDTQAPQPVPPKPVIVPAPPGVVGVEGTVSWNNKMFRDMTIDKGHEAQVKAAASTVLKGKTKYVAVEKDTNLPWYVVGCLDYKESTCHPLGVLHNGERIVGTNRKTTLVPAGRGPFATWHEAAVDAIKLNGKRWEKIVNGSRSVGEILYSTERYNGTGYLTGAGKAETSPYNWACTSVNDGFGKYVADGEFDSNAPTNKTVGIAAILKQLEIDGHISLPT